MRHFILLLFLLGTLSLAAEVTYPAKGNFNNAEGTVEIWFCPKTEMTYQKVWKELYHIFNIQSEDVRFSALVTPNFLHISWRQKFKDTDKCIDFKPRRSPVITFSNEMVLEKDTWYHLAYCWKGKETWSFFQGKQTGNKAIAQRSLPDQILDNGVIKLGGFSPTIIVDDFCISSRARTSEEILNRMKSELKADEDTLLLDNFESTSKDTKGNLTTKATFISGWSKEEGGVANKKVKEDNGKFGKGLLLKF